MIARLKSPEFLIGLVMAMFLVWLCRDALLTRSGWDPDDQLRLVQLRDFLGGQSWFDTTQYRLNAPDGGPMHWSRLIELPLALIVLLLKPLLGQAAAETAAGAIVPLGCLGLIAYMLHRIASHLGGRGAGIVAIIMTAVSPALVMQVRPMRIDHHGWQLVCGALALWSLFWVSARKAGFATGAALAVWLHISLEGAPAAAAFFALLGWRWVVAREEGERLGWAVGTFLGGSLLLYFSTQNSGLAAANHCDTISPAHIWAICAAALVIGPAALFSPTSRAVRLGVIAAAGAVAIGLLLWLAPQCAKGAFSTMDPVVREYWYERVTEGLPVWHHEILVIAAMLGVSATAAALFAWLYRGTEPQQRGELAMLGCLLFYAILLACLVFRIVSFATLVAIPLLAIAIERLFRRYRQEKVAAKRIGLVMLMIFVLMPGALLAIVVGALSGPEDEPVKPQSAQAAENCESLASVGKLAGLPDANIVAPFDIGPAILLTTPHKVLASSHHRNEKGMRDHIDIYRLPEAQSYRIVERRRITHIVACSDEAEMVGYTRRNPDGLWAQLAKGKTPDWLAPMPISGSRLKVWRVVH
jgi:hypothetical protein